MGTKTKRATLSNTKELQFRRRPPARTFVKLAILDEEEHPVRKNILTKPQTPDNIKRNVNLGDGRQKQSRPFRRSAPKRGQNRESRVKTKRSQDLGEKARKNQVTRIFRETPTKTKIEPNLQDIQKKEQRIHRQGIREENTGGEKERQAGAG